MKVFWHCNNILPIAAQAFGCHAPATGGWMSGLLNSLELKDLELVVCFPVSGIIDVKAEYTISGVRFIGYKKNGCTEKILYSILLKEAPDVIHIFGTEYKHSLDAVNAASHLGMINHTVISIQGLVSIYGKYHYTAELPNSVIKSWTIKDLLGRGSIGRQRAGFIERGKFEIEAIQRVGNVIGRTDWDKACVTQMNPQVNYHFCNEILRDSFYCNKWDSNKCEEYSIFVSQSGYPIKGFHFMIEALSLILQQYPSAHLYTTGKDLLGIHSIKEKMCLSSYQRYLIKLINKYSLKGHISFLGSLNETNMCNRFVKSNVFVSPSSIENSPNSVGEAMLLGMPIVASNVGGVNDMLCHKKEGFLYQYNSPYMLAYYVCELFKNRELSCSFGMAAREHAMKTHNVLSNSTTMMSIYSQLSRH